MDRLRRLLETIRDQGIARDNLRGLLHVLIGRRITTDAGAEISRGLTWREAAALLKRVRWDVESVRELGMEPAALPPRDRERFWYAAINRAGVDSAEAAAAAERLVAPLEGLGFVISPPPGSRPPAGASPPPTPEA